MSGFLPDYSRAEIRVSPNFGPRRDGQRPDMIILHYTGMEPGPSAEEWLCDPVSEVSSHYLVNEDGSVLQMVRESDRAWHAGHGSWRGRSDVNSFSIGIERGLPFEEVRRRYHRLVADNHPDRLIARGVPEEFIAVATNRLAAINAAYELIERGLRAA